MADYSCNTSVFAIDGLQKFYQRQARLAFENAYDRDLMPWSWISTTCGEQCLNPEHLIAHSPHNIEYPKGVCIYCGFPANTADHLLPRSHTGEARRAFVALVPACGPCNSAINDLPSPCIDDRRSRAHEWISKRYKTVLEMPDWSKDELAEFGPLLRSHAKQQLKTKAGVLAQLGWPEDPFYDIRAFQKSGIPDPAALGLVVGIPQEAL